ncbi:hypothetical protein [uncultured Deinococcus sp.]|uniref:hypothetical protein n=1 Tax=uncultured Deinococcus sp. TaxID=158789 RepID=UPI0025D461BB|nr:hypothetical protein [uncultured Deinococcus sp.]
MGRWIRAGVGVACFLIGLGTAEVMRVRAQGAVPATGRYSISMGCTDTSCHVFVLDTSTGQTWTKWVSKIGNASWQRDGTLP